MLSVIMLNVVAPSSLILSDNVERSPLAYDWHLRLTLSTKCHRDRHNLSLIYAKTKSDNDELRLIFF
jgi:hypothetical protein